jgi:hypothetical protein
MFSLSATLLKIRLELLSLFEVNKSFAISVGVKCKCSRQQRQELYEMNSYDQNTTSTHRDVAPELVRAS